MARKAQAQRTSKTDVNGVKDARLSENEQKELAAAWERGYSQKGADDGHAWRKNALEQASVEQPFAEQIEKDDSHALSVERTPSPKLRVRGRQRRRP